MTTTTSLRRTPALLLALAALSLATAAYAGDRSEPASGNQSMTSTTPPPNQYELEKVRATSYQLNGMGASDNQGSEEVYHTVKLTQY